MLDWNGVDALVCREVLENDRHVKVFDAKENTLEHNAFDVIHVHNKEWEFADRNQTITGRADLDDLLLRATEERQVVDGNVDNQLLFILLCSLFDELAEGKEFAVQTLALLALLFFLLQFIHVIQLP